MRFVTESSTSNKIESLRVRDDVNYALRYTRFFLICLGIWPNVASNSTKSSKAASKFVIIYTSLTMFLCILPPYIHLMLRKLETNELILLLGPLCLSSTNVIEHIILVFHSDLLKACVKQMENDWRAIQNKSERDIAMENLKIGHGMSFLCAAGMYSSGIFYYVFLPLQSKSTINERNQTVRALAYPGTDLIVDLQAGYNYEILFFNNCIAAFLHCTVINTIVNLNSILVTHACAQIKIIKLKLDNLVEITNDINTVERKIASIIRHHVRVLRFSKTVEQLLCEIGLLEVLISTCSICMLAYYCLSEWKNGNYVTVMAYSVILASMIGYIFIYCYIGELLIEQSQEIGKAAYMIEWYRIIGKTGLAVIMMIRSSHRPCKLTAGGMVDLSLATFCEILKSSFAYLGILQAVTET